jgi:microcystin-dependent protein
MRQIIGEIRAFAGIYTPTGWLLCDGSLHSIRQYELLFTLIDTTYGGDGQNTFAVPDLRGRLIVQNGQLPGGSNYRLGSKGGSESVTLTSDTLGSHNHLLMAGTVPATTNRPNGSFLAAPKDISNPGSEVLAYLPYKPEDTTLERVPLHPSVLSPVGNSQSHENRQPFLCITYIIATQGVFPAFQ